MRKEIAMEKMEKMESVNCFITPIAKTDSGSWSKAYEGRVKMFLNGRIYGDNIVSPNSKKYDVMHKGKTYEIKSACGTIDTIKASYVIYSYNAEIETSYIFTTEDFMRAVEYARMSRIKKMSNGTMRTTLQSFKNSRKKTALWLEAIEMFGEPLV